MPARTRYAKCGELELAYQVVGDGPVEIVLVPSFVSHVEMLWADPTVKAWLDRLTTFAKVVLFDKAGTGLSDPVTSIPTLEDRAAEVEAVIDAAGVERPALFGLSEGGPTSILFAATQPERVRGLVLFGTYSSGMPVDEDLPPGFERRGFVGEYRLDEAQIERMRAFRHHAVHDWGEGKALKLLLPSGGTLQQLGVIERLSASPGMARATIESGGRLDVANLLPSVRVPTLVVHARDDLVPIQAGRFLADHIPGARMVEVEGHDHAPWLSDPAGVAAEVEQFLTGVRGKERGDRVLSTVMFTDIVGSTERAAELGDARWRAVLERHDEVTRTGVEQSGGRLVKSTGDGALATFEGPAGAIHCAQALTEAIEPLGIAVRAGIHTGECEVIGDDVGGLGVHIAARVSAAAQPSEVLVSRTVRDLVVGSGIGFVERGDHELKGVPGRWELLAVAAETERSDNPEAHLPRIETPGPREEMRGQDRVASAVARRAPGVLRGVNRLVRSRRPS